MLVLCDPQAETMWATKWPAKPVSCNLPAHRAAPTRFVRFIFICKFVWNTRRRSVRSAGSSSQCHALNLPRWPSPSSSSSCPCLISNACSLLVVRTKFEDAQVVLWISVVRLGTYPSFACRLICIRSCTCQNPGWSCRIFFTFCVCVGWGVRYVMDPPWAAGEHGGWGTRNVFELIGLIEYPTLVHTLVWRRMYRCRGDVPIPKWNGGKLDCCLSRLRCADFRCWALRQWWEDDGNVWRLSLTPQDEIQAAENREN